MGRNLPHSWVSIRSTYRNLFLETWKSRADTRRRKALEANKYRRYQLVLQCIGNPGIIVLTVPHNVAECAQFARVGVEIDKQSDFAPPFGGFAPGCGEDS